MNMNKFTWAQHKHVRPSWVTEMCFITEEMNLRYYNYPSKEGHGGWQW